MDYLKSLSCRSVCLVFRESIKPLQYRLNVLPYEMFPQELDCAALSKVTRQRERTHSIVPA